MLIGVKAYDDVRKGSVPRQARSSNTVCDLDIYPSDINNTPSDFPAGARKGSKPCNSRKSRGFER